MQSYAQQQQSIEGHKKSVARDLAVLRLKTCIRHYTDYGQRITAAPIEQSEESVLVRQDLMVFIADRIDKCLDSIAVHERATRDAER